MSSRPTAVILRPRRPSDDRSIGALGRSAFRAYTVDAARAVCAMIREPNTRTEVATIDEEPVGVIVIHFDWSAGPFGPFERPAVARLNAIAVQPEGMAQVIAAVGRMLRKNNKNDILLIVTGSYAEEILANGASLDEQVVIKRVSEALEINEGPLELRNRERCGQVTAINRYID